MTIRLSNSRPSMASALLSAAVCAAPLAAVATDYYFQSGKTDFSELSSYLVDGVKPSVPPGANDLVYLPSGTLTVTAPSASFSALSAAGRLVPSSGYTTLVVDIPDASDVCDMGAAFARGDNASHEYFMGRLVKSGAGTLNLTAGASPNLAARFAYYSNIAVAGGVLKAPETATSTLYFGQIAVSNDAMFVIAPNVNTFASGLFGGGIVTNASDSIRTLQIQCAWGSSIQDAVDFSGAIGGPIALTSNGVGSLSGTNSTFGGELTLYHRVETSLGGIPADRYVLEVAKFGMAGEPSSIGTNGTVYAGQYGGSFRYIGKGETTDKTYILQQLNLNNTIAIPMEFSGGATGGLVFEGGSILSKYANAGSFIPRLLLAGSHANACVMAVPINAGAFSFHVKKTGSGRWEFLRAAKGSTNGGAFTIEEGELGYDSLAPARKQCSFGYATNLCEFVSDTKITDAIRIPYAFRLGSEGKMATLDYMGTNRVSGSGRLTGLAGTGRFTTSGERRSEVFFDGVSAIGAGAERTLVLDGEAGTNTFANVTNGAGVVSVVKCGTGTWVIEKETSFSGTLSVKGGTLVVRAPDVPYSWHRLTIKSVWDTDFPRMEEFALYDAAGVRCNKGLVCDHEVSAMSSGFRVKAKPFILELDPGHVSFSDGRDHKVLYTGEDIGKLFDDDSSSKWRDYYIDQIDYPVESNSARWITITSRLPADAGEVISYDFATASATYMVKSYVIEGSQDGVVWSTLTNATFGTYNEGTGEYERPAISAGKWYSTLTDFAANRVLGENEGYRIPGRPEWNGPAALANVSQVFVTSNAVLEAEGSVSIGALAVDCASGGTLKGFSLKPTGTLSLVNVPRSSNSFVLPMTFEDVSGLSNLEDWTVRLNGKVKAAKVVVRDGVPRVFRPGLLFVVY